MKLAVTAVAACALLGLPAFAPAAFAQDKALAVTIYADDLALVQDKRPIDLTGGRQRIEFAGVSGQIRPETVSLSANGVSIVEQNFDFDLLTPAKLMEKAVGSVVTIVRVNPANGQETRGGTPEAFGNHIRAEAGRWKAQIARTGVNFNPPQ